MFSKNTRFPALRSHSPEPAPGQTCRLHATRCLFHALHLASLCHIARAISPASDIQQCFTGCGVAGLGMHSWLWSCWTRVNNQF
jgi:hypothetical protein